MLTALNVSLLSFRFLVDWFQQRYALLAQGCIQLTVARVSAELISIVMGHPRPILHRELVFSHSVEIPS